MMNRFLCSLFVLSIVAILFLNALEDGTRNNSRGFEPQEPLAGSHSRSCSEVFKHMPNLPTGVYWLDVYDPEQNKTIQEKHYCEKETKTGLVYKAPQPEIGVENLSTGPPDPEPFDWEELTEENWPLPIVPPTDEQMRKRLRAAKNKYQKEIKEKKERAKANTGSSLITGVNANPMKDRTKSSGILGAAVNPIATDSRQAVVNLVKDSTSYPASSNLNLGLNVLNRSDGVSGGFGSLSNSSVVHATKGEMFSQYFSVSSDTNASTDPQLEVNHGLLAYNYTQKSVDVNKTPYLENETAEQSFVNNNSPQENYSQFVTNTSNTTTSENKTLPIQNIATEQPAINYSSTQYNFSSPAAIKGRTHMRNSSTIVQQSIPDPYNQNTKNVQNVTADQSVVNYNSVLYNYPYIAENNGNKYPNTTASEGLKASTQPISERANENTSQQQSHHNAEIYFANSNTTIDNSQTFSPGSIKFNENDKMAENNVDATLQSNYALRNETILVPVVTNIFNNNSETLSSNDTKPDGGPQSFGTATNILNYPKKIFVVLNTTLPAQNSTGIPEFANNSTLNDLSVSNKSIYNDYNHLDSDNVAVQNVSRESTENISTDTVLSGPTEGFVVSNTTSSSTSHKSIPELYNKQNFNDFSVNNQSVYGDSNSVALKNVSKLLPNDGLISAEQISLKYNSLYIPNNTSSVAKDAQNQSSYSNISSMKDVHVENTKSYNTSFLPPILNETVYSATANHSTGTTTLSGLTYSDSGSSFISPYNSSEYHSSGQVLSTKLFDGKSEDRVTVNESGDLKNDSNITAQPIPLSLYVLNKNQDNLQTLHGDSRYSHAAFNISNGDGTTYQNTASSLSYKLNYNLISDEPNNYVANGRYIDLENGNSTVINVPENITNRSRNDNFLVSSNQSFYTTINPVEGDSVFPSSQNNYGAGKIPVSVATEDVASDSSNNSLHRDHFKTTSSPVARDSVQPKDQKTVIKTMYSPTDAFHGKTPMGTPESGQETVRMVLLNLRKTVGVPKMFDNAQGDKRPVVIEANLPSKEKAGIDKVLSSKNLERDGFFVKPGLNRGVIETIVSKDLVNLTKLRHANAVTRESITTNSNIETVKDVKVQSSSQRPKVTEVKDYVTESIVTQKPKEKMPNFMFQNGGAVKSERYGFNEDKRPRMSMLGNSPKAISNSGILADKPLDGKSPGDPYKPNPDMPKNGLWTEEAVHYITEAEKNFKDQEKYAQTHGGTQSVYDKIIEDNKHRKEKPLHDPERAEQTRERMKGFFEKNREIVKQGWKPRLAKKPIGDNNHGDRTRNNFSWRDKYGVQKYGLANISDGSSSLSPGLSVGPDSASEASSEALAKVGTQVSTGTESESPVTADQEGAESLTSEYELDAEPGKDWNPITNKGVDIDVEEGLENDYGNPKDLNSDTGTSISVSANAQAGSDTKSESEMELDTGSSHRWPKFEYGNGFGLGLDVGSQSGSETMTETSVGVNTDVGTSSESKTNSDTGSTSIDNPDLQSKYGNKWKEGSLSGGNLDSDSRYNPGFRFGNEFGLGLDVGSQSGSETMTETSVGVNTDVGTSSESKTDSDTESTSIDNPNFQSKSRNKWKEGSLSGGNLDSDSRYDSGFRFGNEFGLGLDVGSQSGSETMTGTSVGVNTELGTTSESKSDSANGPGSKSKFRYKWTKRPSTPSSSIAQNNDISNTGLTSINENSGLKGVSSYDALPGVFGAGIDSTSDIGPSTVNLQEASRWKAKPQLESKLQILNNLHQPRVGLKEASRFKSEPQLGINTESNVQMQASASTQSGSNEWRRPSQRKKPLRQSQINLQRLRERLKGRRQRFKARLDMDTLNNPLRKMKTRAKTPMELKLNEVAEKTRNKPRGSHGKKGSKATNNNEVNTNNGRIDPYDTEASVQIKYSGQNSKGVDISAGVSTTNGQQLKRPSKNSQNSERGNNDGVGKYGVGSPYGWYTRDTSLLVPSMAEINKKLNVIPYAKYLPQMRRQKIYAFKG